MKLARWQPIPLTKLKEKMRAARKCFTFKNTWVFHRGHGISIKKFQCHDGHISRVTRHITESPSSKINPSTPVKGVVNAFFKWPHWCWAYPGIPVQVFWNFIFTGRSPSALWPDGSIGPNVNLCNISNCTTPNHFNCFTQTIFTRALISHLRDNAHLLRCLTHQSSFLNGPGKRLLAIHMLLHLHCL